MFKLLKFLFILSGLIILTLLVLPFFIDANDYKPEISKIVHDATGRNVQIENINLSIFPWIGVTLKGVQLENTAGFQQPYILSVKKIDVQLELIPLLNQQYEVKRFILDTPQIWLEQKADMRNNWNPSQATTAQNSASNAISDVYSQPTKTPTATKTAISSPPIALNAKLLELRHGQVFWSDATTKNITLSDIQLEVKNLQFEEPIDITFAASLGEDTFNISASVGPIGNLNTLDSKKLPALIKVQSNSLSLMPLAQWLPILSQTQINQYGDLKTAKISLDISLEQHVDSMILSSGSVQAQLKDTLDVSWKINSKALKSLNIQELKLKLNEAHILALSGQINNLSHDPSFEVRLETAKLQRIWLNHFLPELQTLYQSHPKPWQSIKLGTLIAGDFNIIDIRDLQLQLDDEPLQISGNMALGSAPDAQLRISANELHLDPWIPQSKTNKQTKAPTSPLTSDASVAANFAADEVEPDLTFLKPWYLSLQLNAKRIHVAKLSLENLRLTLSAEKGVIRLNPLNFEIGEGQITENFTLYANQYPATWKESVKMSGVSVLPILKSVADFDKLSGITQLNTDLTGKGLLPASITKNLNGRGHFVFEDGQFKGLDIAKAARKLKKDTSSQQSSTDFAQMQGNFRIKDGVLSNNDLYMAAPLFRLTGKGKIMLDTLTLDYHVRPQLIDSLAGQGGNKMQQGLIVPLHISGPVDQLDISVEIDRKSLLENAAALNKATGKKVGGVAGKVLKQGFVETREAQKSKATEAAKVKIDEAKARAEEKLKNALKNFKF